MNANEKNAEARMIADEELEDISGGCLHYKQVPRKPRPGSPDGGRDTKELFSVQQLRSR